MSASAAHSLPRRFAEHWDRLAWLRPGQRLAVAVSGGSDSLALLLLLRRHAERRRLQLSVAHFHHGLRPEADADAEFAASWARRLALPFWLCRSTALRPEMPNLEAAARRRRYRFFSRLLALSPPAADAVATGHTADDQAETVLLRLLRGTGPSGLSAIQPVLRARRGSILRPLLPFHRDELQAWLRAEGASWREDASNRDSRRRRNRIRHELLPALERDYNPRLRRRLAALAELVQAEEQVWAELTAQDRGLAAPIEGAGLQVETMRLAALPLARLRRLLRAWAEEGGRGAACDFIHLHAVTEAIHAAAGAAPPHRPRHYRLGGLVVRITPRWVWLRPAPGACGVILKP